MKLNQEQLEARQAEINERNNTHYDEMTDAEKAKVDAVNQAMNILTEAGVRAWVFPMLPNKKCTVEAMFSYNNVAEFLEFPNGIASEEDAKQVCLLKGCLAHNVIGPYLAIAGGSGAKEGEGLVETALSIFYDSALLGSKHIWENRAVE